MAFVGGLQVGSSRFVQRNDCTQRREKVYASTRSRVNMSIAESNDKLADFSKVNYEDVGQFEGVVFSADTSEFPVTRARMNYNNACEAAINSQINVEYTASYAYHAIFAYFDRDTVALPGFAKYFKAMSEEEREHAEKLMKYQNARGGRVTLKPVAVPEMQFTYVDGTSDALYAMDLHLQLEKFVYEKILEVHRIAEEADDPQLMDYLETFLTEQVKAIKVAAQYVAQIRRVGTGHGVYHIDLQLLEGNNIPAPDFQIE